MQTFCCRYGDWHAEVRVEEVQPGRLMAVIVVAAGNRNGTPASLHTVVFEHAGDADPVAETERVMQSLLLARYGM